LEEDQLIWISDGKGIENQIIKQAEYCGVCADPQRKGDDYDHSEAGTFRELTKGVFQISEHS
jgi:hypothetical protein